MKQMLKFDSLFEMEYNFSEENFSRNIFSNDDFLDCIRRGVLNGVKSTAEKFNSGTNSMSVMAHCRHEDVYNCIKTELLTQFPDESFDFVSNISGIERLRFVYKNHIFIVRSVDGTRNQTKQENDYRFQRMGMPVITIFYSLDEMREYVNSISLQYVYGDTSMYTYQIAVSKSEDVFDSCENTGFDIPAIKPKLKNDIQKLASNE